MVSDTKMCPFCAETIKAAAIVCKHCLRDIEAEKVEPGAHDYPFTDVNSIWNALYERPDRFHRSLAELGLLLRDAALDPSAVSSLRVNQLSETEWASCVNATQFDRNLAVAVIVAGSAMSKAVSRAAVELHCPTCSGRDIGRIGVARKVAYGTTFGLLAAGYVSKTFKCRNCGYTW